MIPKDLKSCQLEEMLQRMFNVKEKSSKQYSRNRNYLLFELSRCTNFDINLFVKDFEKLINLINATVMQVVINFVITVKPSNTFQFQTFSDSSK